MNKAYLLLGSNIGEKRKFIERAIELLSVNICKLSAISAFYKSEPWGFECDEWFLNVALSVETTLSPEELINEILKIEKKVGRERSEERLGGDKRDKTYYSRKIDIDIIFYNQMVLDSENLIIPHPKMHERRFVLQPLCDITPGYTHPIFRKTVTQLLFDCRDDSVVSIAD
ncbi:MAG: 2-amino-4-hydroxy-6-hydroxymethyldihydropteridine diphosphokinase [Bacteroidales bacterium]|nr:2-amino-4-hydroxy-6-hydroxymethyldihydropteridine diphosphokinase [Bacteroidales bacterium]